MLSLRFQPGLRVGIACAFLAAAATACDGPMYVSLDGSIDDAASPGSGTLMLVSSSSMAIRPGESGVIEVRALATSGAPQPGVEVSFALEGTALDSTLSALSTRTDAEGHASGTIVAGTQATTFRVRIASRAASGPVYVDVGVGTSFGTMVVRAPYTGSRVVSRRVIDIVPGALCAALMAAPPELGARAVPTGSDELTIAGLPTAVQYGVLVRASSELALVATGCVDSLALEAERTTTVQVAFADAPLSIEGAYAIHANLAALDGATAGYGLLETELVAAEAARGGGARSMLDAVHDELLRRVPGTASDDFSTARAAEELDLALAERLEAAGSAPSALIERWLRMATVAMARPEVAATLVVARPGASIVTTERVTVGDGVGGRVSFAPADLDAALGLPRSVAIAADSTGDSLRVENLTIEAPLGALLLAWLDSVAAGTGAADAGALLAPACDTLATFAAERASLALCDDACVASACSATTAATLAELRTAAAGLDSGAGLAMAGVLLAADSDGDARVDSLRGTLAGAYGAAAVTGEFELSRAPVSP